MRGRGYDRSREVRITTSGLTELSRPVMLRPRMLLFGEFSRLRGPDFPICLAGICFGNTHKGRTDRDR